MNCIDEAMDEVIDVCEEHDERINQIEHGDCERVKALSDEEKKLLAGLIVMLSNKFSYNVHQISFMNNLLALLEIEYDNITEREISCIEQLSDTNVHKMIYQVMCEMMFLVNESTEYSDEFNDMCNEYFAIPPRAKEAILLEIEKSYNTLGKKKYLEKYKDIVVEKKVQRTYPKLEIDTVIPMFEKTVYEYEIEYDVCNDLYEKVFRSESSCRDAYGELLRQPLRMRDAYVESYSDTFVGQEMAEYYSLEIESFISSIYDYVNIHKVRMDITEILELRDNCKSDILNYSKEVVRTMDPSWEMDTFSYYRDALIFEEDTTYIETLFGGIKEVTCYREGEKYNVFWATQQMTLELNTFLIQMALKVDKMVTNKYIDRINNCVNQINRLLGNE